MAETTQKTGISIGEYKGNRVVSFNSFTEIHQFATMAVKTDLVAKAYRGKPEDATIAIIYGMEIGLTPMASLHNIAVINGTPAVWGDAQLSLVQSKDVYEYHKSYFEGNFPDDTFKAVFEAKRKNSPEPVKKEFSIADAKKAKLFDKEGPWKTHAKQMLSYKARAFALREAFADVLKGLHSVEEMEGEEIIDVTPQSKTASLHKMPSVIQESFEKKEKEIEQEEKNSSDNILTDTTDKNPYMSEFQ